MATPTRPRPTGQDQTATADLSATASVRRNPMLDELAMKARPRHVYTVVCRGPDGEIKWRDTIENLVVNEGLDQYLDSLTAAALTLSLGLTDGTPTVAAGDTMASHAGWTEVTAYDEANRVAWSGAAASGQSRTNSGSPASFTINASVTVGGLFMASNNTKGGTTGVLMGAGAFTGGDKSLNSGDTLEATMSLSMSV